MSISLFKWSLIIVSMVQPLQTVFCFPVYIELRSDSQAKGDNAEQFRLPKDHEIFSRLSALLIKGECLHN